MVKVTQVTIEEVIDAIYDASVIVRIRKYGIAPPDGFALVPIEPTAEMFNAAEETGFHSYTGTFVLEPVSVYKAMLNAAKDKP